MIEHWLGKVVFLCVFLCASEVNSIALRNYSGSLDVSDIIAAINDVQRNVTNSTSSFPNVRVSAATVVDSNSAISSASTLGMDATPTTLGIDAISAIVSDSTTKTEFVSTKEPATKYSAAPLLKRKIESTTPIINTTKTTTSVDNKYLIKVSEPITNNAETMPIEDLILYSINSEADTDLTISSPTFMYDDDTVIPNPYSDISENTTEISTDFDIRNTDLNATQDTTGLNATTLNTTEDSSNEDLLTPPQNGIFTYSGISNWVSWVNAMRDPNINPDGPAYWTTIISDGLRGIARYYNPFARFTTRSIQSTEISNALLKVYENRQEIAEALKLDKVAPNINSIINYSQDLENSKIAEKISELINNVTAQKKEDTELRTEGNSTQEVTHVNPLNTGVITKPLDVKIVNFFLKTLYVIVVLAYIPFSGIENFFLAPLPPDMNTWSGQLRFFGLQALLGPDNVVDYNYEEEYDDEYDDKEEEVQTDTIYLDTPLLAGDPPQGHQINAPVNRNDGGHFGAKKNKRKTAMFKKTPKTPHRYLYNDVSHHMKPPPSSYGGGLSPPPVSSYYSYN